MHCQTKKYSGLFFLFLFILNFKSLNTESNSILNNLRENGRNEDRSNETQSDSSSCTDRSSCPTDSTVSSEPASASSILPSNSPFLSKLNPAFENTSANRRDHSSSDSSLAPVSRTNPQNLRPFDRHSITFRSTPNFVLLPDSPFAAMVKLQSSRKKQLDLEFEPVNIKKSDLNYRLDESPTEARGNDEDSESEEAKVKLKQNVDTEADKDRKEIKDSSRDKEVVTKDGKLSSQLDDNQNEQTNRHSTGHLAEPMEMQPDKQVERQADRQSDKRSDEKFDRPLSSRPQPAAAHQPADKQSTDKQFEASQAASSLALHRPINERRNESRNNELRNRRLNEQLIRRLKPSRQTASQSNFSVLRRFYPTQNQPKINANRYSVEDARLATLEIAKVQKEGKCKAPAKRVIPIYKLLNNSQQMKRFLPHCTILHRCETETGCCNSESEQCSVKKQEPVRLPFWVISLSADGQQFRTIEWFTFHNHTECECRMK